MAFGLGIFILVYVLAKDKRKVRQQTMQEAVEKNNNCRGKQGTL